MKRLAFLLLLICPALFGQGNNVKGSYGYGPPSATDPVAQYGIGTQFTDLNTGALYACTAVTTVNGKSSCTWTQAGGSPTGAAGGGLTGTYPNPGLNIAGQWKKYPQSVLIPTLAAQQNEILEPRPFNLTALGASPAILTAADIPTGANVGGLFFSGGYSSQFEIYYTEFLDPSNLTLAYPQAAFAGLHACEAYLGGTWYAVTADNSQGGNVSHGMNILSGTTPLNMTSLATGIVTTGTWGSTTVTNLGNCSLNLISGTYYLFVDAFNGTTWQVWLYSSPNLASGGTWTRVQNTPVVTTAADPVSFRVVGPNLYYMWPHGSFNPILPSDVYFFTSTNLTTWTQGNSSYAVIPRTTVDEGANTALGQVADADLLDWNGRCFLYYSASPNGNTNTYGGGQTIKLAVGDQTCNTMGAAATQSVAQPGSTYANLSIGSGKGAGLLPPSMELGIFGSSFASIGLMTQEFSYSSTLDISSIGTNAFWNGSAYSRTSTSYGGTVLQSNAGTTNASTNFTLGLFDTGGTERIALTAGIDNSGKAFISPPKYTVSGLPSASAAGAGAVVVVTDAANFTGGTCTGGGSNYVVAVSNGTNWICP